MGPRPPRTDRVVLSAILSCGKLSRAEQSAFQRMYNELQDGMIIDLTKKQRLWADSVYDKYNVSELLSEQRREAKVRQQASFEPK